MKKLIGTAIGLAIALQPALSGAELLKNFKVDGSLETQAISARNVNTLDTALFSQIGDAQTRLFLNVGWDLLDDVHAAATVRKNNRIYGTASESVFGVQTVAFFDQANVKIDKLFGSVDAKIGRQFFGEPGDLVAYFGPKYDLYGMPVSALDAVRLDWANDMVGLTGLVGKIAANAAQGAVSGTDSNGTIDVQALIATFKGVQNLSGALQLWRRVIHQSDTTNDMRANDYLWVAGAKAKWTAGGAWIKGEFDHDFGQLRFPPIAGNYRGWGYLVDAGDKIDVPGFGGVTPWAQYADGTSGNRVGDFFATIASDYRPGAIYGLFSVATGVPTFLRSSAQAASFSTVGDSYVWGLGVKAAPAVCPKWTGGVSYWDYRYHGAAGVPTVAGHGNSHIGSEFDVNVDYAHSDNVLTGITLGQFWPGGSFGNVNAFLHRGLSPVSLAQANLTIKY